MPSSLLLPPNHTARRSSRRARASSAWRLSCSTASRRASSLLHFRSHDSPAASLWLAHDGAGQVDVASMSAASSRDPSEGASTDGAGVGGGRSCSRSLCRASCPGPFRRRRRSARRASTAPPWTQVAASSGPVADAADDCLRTPAPRPPARPPARELAHEPSGTGARGAGRPRGRGPCRHAARRRSRSVSTDETETLSSSPPITAPGSGRRGRGAEGGRRWAAPAPSAQCLRGRDSEAQERWGDVLGLNL